MQQNFHPDTALPTFCLCATIGILSIKHQFIVCSVQSFKHVNAETYSGRMAAGNAVRAWSHLRYNFAAKWSCECGLQCCKLSACGCERGILWRVVHLSMLHRSLYNTCYVAVARREMNHVRVDTAC